MPWLAVGMDVDPGQASQIEALAGAGDGHVGQAGFGIINGGRRRWGFGPVSGVVVLGAGEVVCDEHAGPFASLGFVSRGDGDLGVLLGGELGNGGEDGVGAVRVDEVDQELQVAS